MPSPSAGMATARAGIGAPLALPFQPPLPLCAGFTPWQTGFRGHVNHRGGRFSGLGRKGLARRRSPRANHGQTQQQLDGPRWDRLPKGRSHGLLPAGTSVVPLSAIVQHRSAPLRQGEDAKKVRGLAARGLKTSKETREISGCKRSRRGWRCPDLRALPLRRRADR